MRLLCFDHYFAQDIEGLRADRGGHQCWSVRYEPFLRAAMKVFEEEVATGMEAYFSDEHAADRAEYTRVAAGMVDELYEAYRPDAICAPSDTFFWIRAVIERFQQLGVPFVILQKEATIPPGWLEGPAQEWGHKSPFIADHMLVSSQHHAQFWINSGAAPEIIDVTGQPRFDLYARPERAKSLSVLGIDVPSDRPVVLFLTYDVNAYLPIIDRTGLAPWQQLRDETEATLLALAAEGKVTVLIKGHPQPAEDQTKHLAELGREPGVIIVDPQADVRHVICGVDAVIGFQTTALFESLSAGRPTIYTFWSEAINQYADDLIPFHRETEALDVAKSADELRAAIERALAGGEDIVARVRNPAALKLVDTYIGRVDGHAGERCWKIIEGLVAPTSKAPSPARQALDERAKRRRPLHAARALGAGAVWGTAAGLAGVGYPLYRRARERLTDAPPLDEAQFRRELSERRRLAREQFAATRD